MKKQVTETIKEISFISQNGSETQKKELITLMRYLLATSIGGLSSAFFVAAKTKYVAFAISLIIAGFLFMVATGYIFINIISVIYSMKDDSHGNGENL